MTDNSKVTSREFFTDLISFLKDREQESLLISLFILCFGTFLGDWVGILFAITLIIFSFKIPELTIVLLFFSGFLKNIEFIRNSFIDFSIIAVFLLLVVSFIRIIKKRGFAKLNLPDYLIILQGCLVLFSVAFISSGTPLNWWDAKRFIVFNLSLYLGLFLLSVERKGIVIISHWILYGVLVISSSAIHNLVFSKLPSWHLTSFGESYISLGLMIGLGLLFFLYKILLTQQDRIHTIFNFLILGSLVFMIPFTPSRGVLLSLALALLFILFKRPWKRILRFIGTLAFCLIIVYAGWQVANTSGINVKRFTSSTGVYAKSFETRTDYLKYSFEHIKENPIFGIGMGEFMYLHGGKGKYPHNLLVESLVSFGILGLFIFWPTFLISFKNSLAVLRKKNLENVAVVSLWFLFFFFESNLSGSLTNFRMLWLFMGILSVLCYPNKIFHFKIRKKSI